MPVCYHVFLWQATAKGWNGPDPNRSKGRTLAFYLLKCGASERQSVAIYHLDVKTGTRGGGQSASAKYDYLGREGRYAQDAEELEHRESGNLPAWAQDDPRAYWEAADEHERVNGRLFQQVEVALPVELDERQRLALARSFSERLTKEERLPYTLAIHRGGAEGSNPHMHLVISERANDGLERSAEQWFKRANGKQPERGGAKKSRTMMDKHWIAQTRPVWEQEINRALQRAGQQDRVDHRSLAAQREEALARGELQRAAELSREPGVHRGPQTRQADSTVKQRVAEADRINRGLERERREINTAIGRAEREITGIGARLKETYERIGTAIDERIRQAGRAIRAGSEAAGRAGRALGRAGTAIGRAIRTGSEAVGRAGREFDRKHAAVRGTCDGLNQRLRECQRQSQRTGERFGRTLSLIQAEAERKRNAGDRWDRVAGRIESLIQGRMRSRGGPDLG